MKYVHVLPETNVDTDRLNFDIQYSLFYIDLDKKLLPYCMRPLDQRCATQDAWVLLIKQANFFLLFEFLAGLQHKAVEFINSKERLK